MSLDETRAALRSDKSMVVVEAPAGCGKTFEASLLAEDLAPSLPPGREVLLLAHTNAAVQEFSRRTEHVRSIVRVSTIDAFCLQLLEHYASQLDLPVPLRRNVGKGGSRVDFSQLAPKAVELLRRCPAVARIVGLHFPTIILDEHQDARPDQHEVATIIANTGGSRLRIFGDPMQAIYDRRDTNLWRDLAEHADEFVQLDTPHRWSEMPELGGWIMEARSRLRRGQQLPTEDLPARVRLQHVPRMPDPRFGHGLPQYLCRPVHEYLQRSTGPVAILCYTNDMARDMHICSNGRLVVNEGSDFERAYDALEKTHTVLGQPERMAAVLLEVISATSTGLDRQKRTAIDRALQVDRIEPGRNKVIIPVLSAIQHIYASPSMAGFCTSAAALLACRPEWLTLRLPETLRMLGRIRPQDDDPFSPLDAVVELRKRRPPRPQVVASTVHKAKGMEFDNVLICPFSATHFPDTEFGRRLAYVAISRARNSLDFLVPGAGPSPLV